MRARLEEAEERRRAQSEAKLKAVRETTGLERHGRMRSASATRREAHYSATLEKRQQQLQEMRDKLREKHKKHDMIRLKQQGRGHSMEKILWHVYLTCCVVRVLSRLEHKPRAHWQ